MKKRLLSLLLVLLTLSSLHAFSLGYGISTSGLSGKLESASVNIKGVADLFNSKQLLLTANAGFGNDKSLTLGLNTLDLKLSAYPIVFSNHIFEFMFINNMAYAPGIGAGVLWDRAFEPYWTISFDLVHLYDTQYVYDFFSPMVYFDKNFNYAGWGIELFNMTFLFGGR